MVGCGIIMLLIIAASFWSVIRNRIGEKKWLLRGAVRYSTAVDRD
jgi:cytochrome d ubiquinol oxidase subunit I